MTIRRLLKSTLYKSGSSIELSGKEIRLIEYLLKRDGQVVTREQIISAVWGSSYDGTISRLFLGEGKRTLGKNSYSVMNEGR